MKNKNKKLLHIISLMLGTLILSTPIFALEGISINSNTDSVLDEKAMTRTNQQTVSADQVTDAGSEFTYMEDSKYIKLTGYTGERQDVILPSEINGKPVTAINSRMFKDNTNLLSVRISNSITTIEKDVFTACSNLKRVYIPIAVTSIHDDAFDKCTQVEIYGYSNSYAESYAKTKKIPFVAIDMEMEPELRVEFNPYGILILNGGMMNLEIKVTNTGDIPISLDDFQVEYYYTNDNDMEQKIRYQYASKGDNTTRVPIKDYLKVEVAPMEEIAWRADTLIHMSFISGVGTLEVGEDVLFNIVVYNDNWKTDKYILENDHSYVIEETVAE